MERDAEASTNPFLRKSTNPFDDDIDDDTFLKPSTSRFMATRKPKLRFFDNVAQGDIDMEVRKEHIQSKTLASTERSLAVLMESEMVGEGIAKELTGQREQLEKCHRKVDDINANLRNSQKHLSRIKSFFGGFKDFLMGVRIKPVRISKPVDKSQSAEVSFGDNLASVAHRSRSTTVKETASSHPGSARRASGGDNAKPRDQQNAIDRNIDQMFNHVVNLKGLAADFGDELASQNELIDSLNDKTEEAQSSLTRQNRVIAKLLK